MSILSNLSSLDRRVLRQLGGGKDAIQSAKDAASHGADSGFNGFVYTHECVAFFKRNRAAILGALTEMASDCGQTSSAMLAGFRCLKGIEDPMAALANPKSEDCDMVANALAWFALEECGRHIEAAEGN